MLKIGKLEDLQKFKNEIEKMYNENITLKNIAEHFGCSRDTISRFLQRNNIAKRKKINPLYKNFSEEDDLRIKELYESGKSTREIGKIMDTSGITISKHLQNMGVTIRDLHSSRLQYTFNESYFETIDSEHKAYWLGFVAADGCVLEPTTCISKRTGKRIKKENGALQIALQERDKNHLSKFQQDILDYHPLIYSPTRKAYGLKLCSNKICADLKKYGILPRKSLIFKFPYMLEENPYFRDFIRGYFDGDGSISFSKHNGKITIGTINSSLIGTENLLNGIKKHIKTHENIKSNIIDLNPNIYQEVTKVLCFPNIKTNKKFLDFIYKNATIYLDRKYDRYLIFNKLYDNYILQQYKKGKI